MSANGRLRQLRRPAAAMRSGISHLLKAIEQDINAIDFSISSSLSRALDLLRSLAAFFVVANHIGEALFRFEHGLDPVNLVAFQFFYLGHQAVMVLFVVSGFLIGRAAMQCVVKGSQSAFDYGVDRMTRIYVVLLPALLIGFVSDQILAHVASGPDFDYVMERTSFLIFLGNLVGLQTVLVPTFGSNGPLWSLACELWYYVMFPAFLVALFGRSRRSRWMGAAVLMGAFAIISEDILRYGTVWCLGVLCWLPRRRLAPKWLAWSLLACCLATANNEYLWAHGWGFPHIVVTGLSVALILNAHRHDRSVVQARGGILSKFFAKFTYSLYLYHYPPLMILTALLVGHGFVPYGHVGAAQALEAIALLMVLYGYSYALFWLTERNYHQLRAFFRAKAAPLRSAVGSTI